MVACAAAAAASKAIQAVRNKLFFEFMFDHHPVRQCGCTMNHPTVLVSATCVEVIVNDVPGTRADTDTAPTVPELFWLVKNTSELLLIAGVFTVAVPLPPSTAVPQKVVEFSEMPPAWTMELTFTLKSAVREDTVNVVAVNK